jgi:CHAD domain-containing protein
MPAVDAARRSLRIRLEIINDHLNAALREPDKDPEHVHQLRVGVRRAVAALDIFAALLPAKNYEAAFRTLRALRRSAGRARDWDVFLLALAELEPAPAVDLLTGLGLAHRMRAQTRLVETGTGYAATAEGFADELILALRARQPLTLHALGRPLLLDLLEQFRTAASRDLDDYEHLHRVRIIGKRLRYAMEMFADCFALPFREVIYPRIEAMQDILGRANDSHVAVRMLVDLRDRLRARASWKRYRHAFDRLVGFHQRRLPAERKLFLRWWQQWQQDGVAATLVQLVDQPVLEQK